MGTEEYKIYLLQDLQAHIIPNHCEFLITYYNVVEPILEVLLYIAFVFFILVMRLKWSL